MIFYIFSLIKKVTVEISIFWFQSSFVFVDQLFNDVVEIENYGFIFLNDISYLLLPLFFFSL